MLKEVASSNHWRFLFVEYGEKLDVWDVFGASIEVLTKLLMKGRGLQRNSVWYGIKRLVFYHPLIQNGGFWAGSLCFKARFTNPI